MFTDSHCHLNFPDFQGRIPEVLADMARAQVSRAVCICTTLEEFAAVHQLALDHPNLWATVGVHPDNEGVQEPTLADLLQRAALPRVVAIGETGLDYFRLGERTVADMAWQRARFRTHIEAARCTDLPLVIHTRSASDDTLAILRESGGWGSGAASGAGTQACPSADSGQGGVGQGLPLARGVFHCFTETMAVARAALDLGFFISMSGILTFKTAHELREVAAFVPLDRLLIETDSPYLAPMPHRGKTNSPAYVPHVAAMVARVKGVAVEEVARITSDNTTALFSRMAAAPAGASMRPVSPPVSLVAHSVQAASTPLHAGNGNGNGTEPGAGAGAGAVTDRRQWVVGAFAGVTGALAAWAGLPPPSAHAQTLFPSRPPAQNQAQAQSQPRAPGPPATKASTDFFTAVQRDDLSEVLLLQLRGAELNALDPKGQHALHVALRYSALKVAEYLVQRPTVEVDLRNPQGETPLMLALLKGHTALARALAAREADINKTGWAPLHYAATYAGKEATEQVQWLLDQSAYIDAESPNGTTPLMMAAHYGSTEVVQLLLEAGADANLRNQQQLTAMDFAQKASRPSVAELMAARVRAAQPRGRW